MPFATTLHLTPPLVAGLWLQAVFMAYAFGGAPEYPGPSLAAVHARLVREKGLDLTHFDKVCVCAHACVRACVFACCSNQLARNGECLRAG